MSIPQISPEMMDAFEGALAIIAAGGTIGGMAEILAQVGISPTDRDDANPIKGKLVFQGKVLSYKQFLYLLPVGVLIGISGALAVQFVLILLGSARFTDTLSDLFFLLSVSVAGGFGARRLLPRIADRLEKDIKEIEQKNVEQDRSIENLNEEMHLLRYEADTIILMQQVQSALNENALPSFREDCITRLKSRIAELPTDRNFNLKASSLQKLNGNYLGALETARAFYEALEKTGGSDDDKADALYNCACYLALLERRDESLADLAKSIALKPENKKDAAADQDFNMLRSDKEFQVITGDTP